MKSLKYKKIEIPFKHQNADVSALELLSAKYPKEEIFFEVSKNTILTYLRQLDLQIFRQDIEKYISDKNGSAHLFTYLLDILEAIESIKSYGLKSGKRVYVEYNEERKVKNREQKEQKRQTYFYALQHPFSKQNQDLPADFENQIICGDSQEILQKLPNNCIDLIFTSPPYNFGLEYAQNQDDHLWQKYFEKLFAIFDECIRVLKFGGRIIVNIQPLFSDYIPTHHIISKYFMDKKLIWKGEILWEKNNYNCKYTAWGSWKSPSNPYLKYTWEFLEIFAKGTLKKEGRIENADISGDDFKKWVYAKWSIAPERKMKEYEHPAMFPEELAYRVLKLFSFQNDIVLDPFNGVGTTTAVAKMLNRRFVGIDISEKYCQMARKRIDSNLF
ncbi:MULTISPECIES: DNA-methyltransferase [Raineya]|jgi:DNA modification methylase|uniref:Methyltransferase n=1 Tax=Raineya orbicola TaxID=2016530 RepID=A0A2N3I9C9_9BACT|nr:site-specific DNA-methyltransferase [Raineya orbicola]PKQ66858.1 DNA methylase [Raineya orbicola]